MNEKDYIRNILASKKKPDDLSMGYFITLIAKYYYSEEFDAKQLSDIVKKKLLEFSLDNYQEYLYHNKIVTICNGLLNGDIEIGFKEKDCIPIYENEFNFINSLPNDRQKKLMFTFFAVARYMDCGGWINKKTSKGIAEIFKLANVTVTSQKRNELLHELYKNGHISFGKKIDNMNIRVNLDDSGDVVYKVKEFSNIGNQYIGNFKKGYKQCKECKRIIKDTGNKKMYCNKCALKKEQIRKRNTAFLYRETQKSSEIENRKNA